MKTPEIIDWIEGLKLKIYPGNEIYRAIFVRGIYDPNLIVVVNSFLTDGSVFIDAGTGIGHFSLLASRVIGKNGRIYAVEPSSRDFERLCDNIELNKLPDVVHPRQFAFLDKNGTEQLSIACEERNLINTIGTEFSSKGVDKIKTEKVNVVRIDDFVENERINKVDFIKLDVEGSETRALRGARNTIEKYRPSLMVGVNETALKSCGSCLKELQQMLRDFKYRTYRLRDDSFFTLEPVSDITKEHVNVVFCLPEDIMPPVLPRPKQLSSVDVIRDFLSK
jgi:FkbM family methyltransferase